jgi:hypothetical protein
VVEDDPRPYADYLPEPLYPGFVDPEAPTSAPEPGTGTVWVIPPEEDLLSDQLNVPGRWQGVWRAEVRHTGVSSPTKVEAVVWALCQPATQWLARDRMDEPWVDLTRISPPGLGTGTVWVIPPVGNGPWGAAWVAEGAAKLASLRGTQEAVVAWALAQPAVRWLTPVLQPDGNFDWGDLKPAR